jgi:two-component system NtrC family sensor kinase
MKPPRVAPDLLTPLVAAESVEDGLAVTLRRLIAGLGASAGALAFRPPGAESVVVIAGTRRVPAQLEGWLRDVVGAPAPAGVRIRRVSPPSAGRRPLALARAPLRSNSRTIGALALLGPARALDQAGLRAGLARVLGLALERIWYARRWTLRMAVLNEIMRRGAGPESLDEVLGAFADGLARLVRFDSVALSLLDPERGEFTVVDLPARSLGLGARRDARMTLADTLLAAVAEQGAPTIVDDLAAPSVPPRSREIFAARGYRSALFAPLASRGRVFGAVTLVARSPRAFDAGDAEIVGELAGPLAFAVEQRRLLEDTRRRAEELAGLYQTSRAITARLDTAAVLDQISRAVTTLIGSTGCGIGLLDDERSRLTHVAAHGFRTAEWRALSIPLGEGVIGRSAESGQPLRVDDIRVDPRSARRDIDEHEGIRSLLCVPLRVGGQLIGVISAFSTQPAMFTAHHQRVLEAFAEQAGIAIHNAQLFEESEHRTRELRALLEAGRTVTASLDVGETIRGIMEQARGVLGVDSCSVATLEPDGSELVTVASLDLPTATASAIRLKVGEGIAGRAVAESRPVQCPDLFADQASRYWLLRQQTGFRSMLAVPLRIGPRVIGSLSVFRSDVHHFSAAEEDLLVAFADQAAIALEHARLYAEQEAVVAERTRELDVQKRFVEVVLETLPLGLFVLDAGLRVERANREGAEVLACDATRGCSFPDLFAADRGAAMRQFLEAVFAAGRVERREEEVAAAGETKTYRVTAAPVQSTPEAGGPTHLVVLVEDVTPAKRLERQMLLTERLTTAGRLAAGVAHELNNPLATIAGCAEALTARTGEDPLAGLAEMDDFRHYLRLIQEEAFRCKEITGSLLQFVREPGGRRAPTDLNALVERTRELLAHQSRFSGRQFVTELDPALEPVVVNEGQIRQLCLGLAANALEAMDADGVLTVRTRRRRDEVEIEFEDEGPGIPDEVLARIFDPFFTTKPPGQGTGLGLAIAQGIATDHGGRIEVNSRVGKGSTFRLVLPA